MPYPSIASDYHSDTSHDNSSLDSSCSAPLHSSITSRTSEVEKSLQSIIGSVLSELLDIEGATTEPETSHDLPHAAAASDTSSICDSASLFELLRAKDYAAINTILTSDKEAIYATNDKGETLVMSAIQMADQEALEAVLPYCPQTLLNVCDHKGLKASDHAEEYGNYQALHLINTLTCDTTVVGNLSPASSISNTKFSPIIEKWIHQQTSSDEPNIFVTIHEHLDVSHADKMHLIDYFITAGYDTDITTADHSTAMIHAVHSGDLEYIKKLHFSGTDLNATDNSGISALQYISIASDPETIEYFESLGYEFAGEAEFSCDISAITVKTEDSHSVDTSSADISHILSGLTDSHDSSINGSSDLPTYGSFLEGIEGDFAPCAHEASIDFSGALDTSIVAAY